MSTTATINTNKGWTFPDDKNPITEFPTTTESVNNWGIPPAAPSPPLSAVGHPHTNDHASLHGMACYDDYCNTHHQMKDNNYYPRRGNDRRCRSHQQCDCPNAHLYELAEAIRVRHLNPCKACADWQKGKRVCPDCRFLVNLNDHHLHCQSTAQRAPLANIMPPQEAPVAAEENPDAEAATPPDDQICLLAEIITTVQNTVIQEARHNYGIQCLWAQTMRDQHNAGQRQLQRMARTLETITAEQQRINEQQTQQQARRPIRIYRTRIRRRTTATRSDHAGASVWTGDLLSRIWGNRLLGTTVGAVLTLATLWLIRVSTAMATVILHT